jgi:AraC-like DNA-binding protein
MRYRPIRNSAQLAPNAVRFQACPPAPDLAPYVSDFWQYDVLPPHDIVPIQVFPSGCVVLRFNISTASVQPILYGPSLRPDMKSVFVRRASAFGVALRIEGARALIGCDIAELADRRIDLGLVWRLDELCEKLWLASHFDLRVEVLADFLRRRLCPQYAPHPDLVRAIANLQTRAGRETLTRDTGANSRTLRRHFERNVGLSPKQLERVMRVQASLGLLARTPDLNCAHVALEAGFSDQPHFNREFKRLLDMSPGQFSRYVGRFHELRLVTSAPTASSRVHRSLRG